MSLQYSQFVFACIYMDLEHQGDLELGWPEISEKENSKKTKINKVTN